MMNSRNILLIQAGTPPDGLRAREGDLPVWFGRALGVEAGAMQVVRVFEGEALPAPGLHRVAIITGSWDMVTDRLGWSEAAAEWIRRAMDAEMPMFGVCYGHQLMSHALGGVVDYHPDGLEIGCKEIELLQAGVSDSLGAILPARFSAHVTHMQSVMTPPPGAQVLGRSAQDAHQIIRYGAHAISAQFHPEFTPAISAACVMGRAEMLRGRGEDPQVLLDAMRDTPLARGLLRHFVQTYVDEVAA